MSKIKLCGLRRLEDITYVNEARPDYIGFVFAASRRQVGPSHARLLKERLDSSILSVGVFVNEKIDIIAELLNDGLIDIAQLHGREKNEDIIRLKELTGKPVIKAVAVIDESSIREWEGSAADLLLLDHGKGGTGQSFDWSMIPAVSIPYFLAGGISIKNVEQAVALHPFGIDISSGIETDGKKDRDKILEIVGRIRNEFK